jgi:hypothetical protein
MKSVIVWSVEKRRRLPRLKTVMASEIMGFLVARKLSGELNAK